MFDKPKEIEEKTENKDEITNEDIYRQLSSVKNELKFDEENHQLKEKEPQINIIEVEEKEEKEKNITLNQTKEDNEDKKEKEELPEEKIISHKIEIIEDEKESTEKEENHKIEVHEEKETIEKNDEEKNEIESATLSIKLEENENMENPENKEVQKKVEIIEDNNKDNIVEEKNEPEKIEIQEVMPSIVISSKKIKEEIKQNEINQEKSKLPEEKKEEPNKEEDSKEREKEIRLSVIAENSEEYINSSISLSLQQQSEKNLQQSLSDEKKLEIVKSLLPEEDEGEEDQLQKQIQLSKRISLDSVGLPSKKDEKPKSLSEQKTLNINENNDSFPSLYEIKEENLDENNQKEKEKEDEQKNAFESKPSASIPKKVKEMRRVKTDGYLPTFGGDSKAVEERKNRLAKRLNKAKEVSKKREEENKYRKSVDIAFKASLLENKMGEKNAEKNEDNKDS